MKLSKNKKGQVMNMADILVGGGAILVVATLLLAFSSDVNEDVSSGFEAGSFAANISDKGDEALFNTSSQLPNVGTLLGVTVILGLVIGVAAIARFRR